jgi:hypothetical protein
VTAALSFLLDQPLRTVVPPAAHQATYLGCGLVPLAAALMTEMLTGFNRGWIAFAGGSAEQHTGPTLLEDALRQYVGAGLGKSALVLSTEP